MNNLGFGTMRLPLKSADPADFDYDQLNLMVDAFLEAGYTCFRLGWAKVRCATPNRRIGREGREFARRRWSRPKAAGGPALVAGPRACSCE